MPSHYINQAPTAITPTSLSPLRPSAFAKRTGSAPLKRLRRFLLRQAPLILGLACVTWLIGGLYVALNGVTPERIVTWGIFGLMVGALIAVAHEIGRGAISDIAAAERASSRRVASAAPQVPSRALRSLSPDMRTPLGCAIYQPASDYATSIRHVLSTLGDAQVVALLGSTPRDGATATASSVAALASQQGRNVLLVDCDLRQRGVTHLLDAEPEAGVLEAAANPQIWPTLIEQEPETGLHVMPAARLSNPWQRLFDEPGLVELVAQWRERYDLIVLDCPPALTNADGAMLTRLADLCVPVISWDDTSSANLRQMMRRLRQNAPETISLHINRAPLSLLSGISSSRLERA